MVRVLLKEHVFDRGMAVYQGTQWSRVMLKAISYSIVTIRQTSLVNTKTSTLATATTVKDYLDEKQFNYKEGHTSYMVECPICDNTIKQENGASQYCVHINKTTGSVTCQPCKMSGTIIVHCVCVYVCV